MNRHQEPRITVPEVQRRIRQSFRVGICLAPNAPEGCKGRIVRAHTIQRRGNGLTTIARQGHVYYFKPGSRDPNEPRAPIAPTLTGIGEASTFTGFCEEHDRSLFAAIEREPLTLTEEQLVRLAYRPLCRELYAKQQAVELYKSMRDADSGRPVMEQIRIQTDLDDLISGSELGLRDLRASKARFDAALLSGDSGAVRYAAIWLNRVPNILCSTNFSPDYDFHGRLIQRKGLMDEWEAVSAGTFGIGDGRGVFVITWLDPAPAAELLAASLLDLSDEELPDAINRFLIEFSDNVCIEPNWWEGLPVKVRDHYQARMLSGAMPDTTRRSSCLLDDGIREATFAVESRTENFR